MTDPLGDGRPSGDEAGTAGDVVPAAEVVIVGDGVAGAALGRALHVRGVDVVVVGPDRPWEATYAGWIDDVRGEEVPVEVPWLSRTGSIAVDADGRRAIPRPYGVLDGDRLRRRLRDGVAHRDVVVERADDLDARLVVDATGWPSGLDRVADRPADVAWQTAFGVVLAAPPAGPLGAPTVMDWSDPGVAPSADDRAVPSFAYALEVADGWLVEETVLAARPAVEPELLARRLARRLGRDLDDLLADAVRVERVRIPMGAPPRTAGSGRDGADVVRFGASAGMIHPATGYSVASSIGTAGRVADAVVEALDGSDAQLVAAARAAVWPRGELRARALHDYGLSALLGADAATTRSFFAAFFSLEPERWAPYLRRDASGLEVAAVMAAMFRRADWRLRARLVSRDPRPFLRLVRP
ncbi:lycopene cyclase family protein [Ilumatobacter sp.]|uniref:lycopene cyclase family protein n=1 Tax=Ilumatobacter sp. TaxID=1967498 RepID=UPI003B523FFD